MGVLVGVVVRSSSVVLAVVGDGGASVGDGVGGGGQRAPMHSSEVFV